MNQTEVSKFKNLFENLLKSEIFEEKNLELTLIDEVAKGDDVDRLNAENLASMDLRLQGRNAIYARKIQKALLRVTEGSFGQCEDCGCDISRSRLLARPTADLCITCKEDEEKIENGSVHGGRHSIVSKTNVLQFKPKKQQEWKVNASTGMMNS
jgi:DnaK suppressor protein